MNFDLSEEETMLEALADRFAAERYDIERRRTYQAQPYGFSQENWDMLGEFGLMAAPVAPEHGGLGLTAGAMVTLFMALGRGLVVEPLCESVLVGSRLLLAGADESLAAHWADDLCSGRRRVALAHCERTTRGVAASAQGVRISGEKHCVPAGLGADAYIVSAVGDQGVELYLVPADAPGLSVTPWRMIDGSLAALLRFDNVEASHRLSGGLGLLDAIMPLADLARAAEAVGVMQRIFDESLEYLRTRSQFNTALGRFQAIQHRMVAHYAALEQSKALINSALVAEGQEGFASAVHGARAFISQVSVELGHDMIQFHGGMGVTDELSIGHGHKRLVLLSRWPEDPLAQLDRYAQEAA
ncbi:acyl-CoA dehydrogenase family protein [Novosphingobium humi]|uniref:Acyl-CoA dehydrogenase family protein n=1 Tax=Novosphingobium humi TaxID=2282397 RepID=A0ABY7U3X8_9SPHN|nr:acyl-CoA dehydrogenase family protein [Novosphingobium humi]WCT80195.1 acyl-CoA dehydrogenase family protein [Novosphingobium humi]